MARYFSQVLGYVHDTSIQSCPIVIKASLLLASKQSSLIITYVNILIFDDRHN
ncbi:MAG: hypothetical protein Q8P17_01340 [bacterium]|nr:hypothetical protein [bacterium]